MKKGDIWLINLDPTIETLRTILVIFKSCESWFGQEIQRNPGANSKISFRGISKGAKMAFTVTIPDDVLGAIKLPYQQIRSELTREIAFTLYARGLVSMGIARRFADMSKSAFIEGLAIRDIDRHYHDDDADEDISYARSCQ